MWYLKGNVEIEVQTSTGEIGRNCGKRRWILFAIMTPTAAQTRSATEVIPTSGLSENGAAVAQGGRT